MRSNWSIIRDILVHDFDPSDHGFNKSGRSGFKCRDAFVAQCKARLRVTQNPVMWYFSPAPSGPPADFYSHGHPDLYFASLSPLTSVSPPQRATRRLRLTLVDRAEMSVLLATNTPFHALRKIKSVNPDSGITLRHLQNYKSNHAKAVYQSGKSEITALAAFLDSSYGNRILYVYSETVDGKITFSISAPALIAHRLEGSPHVNAVDSTFNVRCGRYNTIVNGGLDMQGTFLPTSFTLAPSKASVAYVTAFEQQDFLVQQHTGCETAHVLRDGVLASLNDNDDAIFAASSQYFTSPSFKANNCRVHLVRGIKHHKLACAKVLTRTQAEVVGNYVDILSQVKDVAVFERGLQMLMDLVCGDWGAEGFKKPFYDEYMSPTKCTWARCYQTPVDGVHVDHNNALEGTNSNLYGDGGRRAPYYTLFQWGQGMAETVLAMASKPYAAPGTPYHIVPGVTPHSVVARVNGWKREAAAMYRHLSVRAWYLEADHAAKDLAELAESLKCLEADRRVLLESLAVDFDETGMVGLNEIIREIEGTNRRIKHLETRQAVTDILPSTAKGTKIPLRCAACFDVVRFKAPSRARRHRGNDLDVFLKQHVLGVIEVTHVNGERACTCPVAHKYGGCPHILALVGE